MSSSHAIADLFEQGKALYKSGEYQQALVIFNECLKAKNKPIYRFYRAFCHFELQQLKEAFIDFEEGFRQCKKDELTEEQTNLVLDKLHACEEAFIPEAEKFILCSPGPLHTEILKEIKGTFKTPIALESIIKRFHLWELLYAIECARCDLQVMKWYVSRAGKVRPHLESSIESYIKSCEELSKAKSLYSQPKIQKHIQAYLIDQKECAKYAVAGDFKKAEEYANPNRSSLISILYQSLQHILKRFQENLLDQTNVKNPTSPSILFETTNTLFAAETLLQRERYFAVKVYVNHSLAMADHSLPDAWFLSALTGLSIFKNTGLEKKEEATNNDVLQRVEKNIKLGLDCYKNETSSSFYFLLAEFYFLTFKSKEAFFNLLLGFVYDKEEIPAIFANKREQFLQNFSEIYEHILKNFLSNESHQLKSRSFLPGMKRLAENRFSHREDCLKLANTWAEKNNLLMALFYQAMAFWIVSIKLDKKAKPEDLEKLKQEIIKTTQAYAKTVKEDGFIQAACEDIAERFEFKLDLSNKAEQKKAPAKDEVNLRDRAFDAEKKRMQPAASAAKKKKKKKPKKDSPPLKPQTQIAVPPSPPAEAVPSVETPLAIEPAAPEAPPESKEKILKATYLKETVSFPSFILNVFENLKTEHAYIVGGWMCEALLPQGSSTDIDIVFGTEENPEDFLKRCFPNGKITRNPESEHDFTLILPHPTEPNVTIKFDMHHSLFLSDSKLSELEALHSDAQGRDFTANALYGKKDGTVIDGTGRSLSDLQEGRLKSIIQMEKTFEIDFIRALRAIYFKTKRAWKVTDNMIKALKNISVAVIQKAIQENPGRVNHWILKLLRNDHAEENFKLLCETDLLKSMFPDLAVLFQSQPESKDEFMKYIQNLGKLKHGLNTIYGTWAIFISNKTGKLVSEIIESNPLFEKNFNFFTEENAFDAFMKKLQETCPRFFKPYSDNKGGSEKFTAKDFRRLQRIGMFTPPNAGDTKAVAPTVKLTPMGAVET